MGAKRALMVGQSYSLDYGQRAAGRTYLRRPRPSHNMLHVAELRSLSVYVLSFSLSRTCVDKRFPILACNI